MRHFLIAVLLLSNLFCDAQKTSSSVKFYGDPKARIAAGVTIPEGKKLFIVSGIVANPVDTTKPVGSPERYGDTKTQAIGILTKIEVLLKEAGLSMKDVVNLQAFVTPDKNNQGNFDFKGWNEAYD